MSRENVELVRTVLEAFKRRDVDEILDHWHADAEWRPALSPGGLEGTTYVGHEGVRRWVADWRSRGRRLTSSTQGSKRSAIAY